MPSVRGVRLTGGRGGLERMHLSDSPFPFFSPGLYNFCVNHKTSLLVQPFRVIV